MGVRTHTFLLLSLLVTMAGTVAATAPSSAAPANDHTSKNNANETEEKASSSPLHRRLTPRARSLELMELARNTHWHRELTAAAHAMSRRRERRRRRRRNLKEQQEPIDAAADRTSLRKLQSSSTTDDKGSKYNSYLPQQSHLDGVDGYGNNDNADNNQDDIHDEESDECLSPLQRWFLSLLESIGSDTWEDLQTYNITTLAYLYKHYVSTADGTEEYFGTYGDRTLEMKVNHQKMVEFWSVSQLGDHDNNTNNNDGSSNIDGTGTTNNNNNANSGSGSANGGDEEVVIYTENAAFSFSDPNNNNNNNNDSDTSDSSQTSPKAPAANVILLGMHGVDIADDAKLFPTLQRIYHLDIATTKELGNKIQSIVMTLPGAFNNPILTSNAVAIQSADNNLQNADVYDGRVVNRNERDSIVVGDGVFHFLEWLGLEKDGMDYIHSHEFGHHIQYEMGVGSTTGSSIGGSGNTGETVFYDDEQSLADRTRRLELMADSFGSYYLGHSRGGRLDAARLAQIHQTAFSLGDCQIDTTTTHHGTPRQRECASNYGSQLAMTSYVDGGYVIEPEELMSLFKESLNGILSLDEGICEWVVDSSVLDENVYGDMYAIFEEKYMNGGSSSGSANESSSENESGNASGSGMTWSNDPKEDTTASSNGENIGIGEGYFTTSLTSAPSSTSNSGNDGHWFDWNPPDASSPSSLSSSSTSQQQDPWGQEQSWGQEPQQQWETYPTDTTDNRESTLDYPPPIIEEEKEDDEGNENDSEAGWFEQSKWGDASTTYYRTTSGGAGILAIGLDGLLMLVVVVVATNWI